MTIIYITDREVINNIKTNKHAEINSYLETLKSNTKGVIIGLYIYDENNALNKISKYIDTLEVLICRWNQLTSIPVLPNLTVLHCDSNLLTSIPVLPNLTDLHCDSNLLTSIPVLPNLTKLHCGWNQLTSIPVLPNLTVLYCYSSKLTSIPILPNLTYLNCGGNQLKSIPVLPNLTELYCMENQLKSIPVMQNLTVLHCENNPIPELNLIQLNRILLKNQKNIYTDTQNVHNHTIQENLKQSINYLIHNYSKYELPKNIEFPHELDHDNFHSELCLTEKEIFELVLKRIYQFEDNTIKQELEKILYDELENGRCKCFTGRITRIVNSLVGFDENITIGISDNEQIMNVYDVLLKQGKLTKDNFKNELKERGYTEEIINTWTEAIDE